VIEHDPIGTDARHAERLRRLGPGPHICLFCGIDDPRGILIPKPLSWLKARVPRSVLEDHHVLCRNHDPNFVVLLCILCHFKVTQGYLQAGIDMRYEPNPQKRVAFMLKALAVFFEMLAETLRQWAALLDKGSEAP